MILNFSAPRAVQALALAVPLACCGCEPINVDRTQPVLDASSVPAAGPEAERLRRQPASRAKLIGREAWDVYYLGSNRIGYSYTRWRPASREPDGVAAEGVMRLSVNRFGQPSTSEMKMSYDENGAGVLRRFSSETVLGPTPTVTRGEIDAGVVRISVNSGGGASQEDSHVWTDATRGYFALDEELLCQPMEPGEERTFEAIFPPYSQSALYQLRALRVEKTELLDGPRDLLHVEMSVLMPGAGPMTGTLWADPTGEVLKQELTSAHQITYRTTKEVALASGTEGKFDLGEATLVRLAKPLADPHHARELRYRVTLADVDPVHFLPTDLAQSVKSIDMHTAEVTIRAVRPNDPPAVDRARDAVTDRVPTGSAAADERTGEAAFAGAGAPPTDDERQPNALIQSDNPLVVRMAHEVGEGLADPWRVAVALERYVHAKVATKDYGQTLASAAEVAQSLSGDCTEHAVLLAALLRARGLPSRVAIGLVYTSGKQAFAFHMWTEVYINDRWIGLDGTLGLSGIGGGHLKLGVTSLKDKTACASLLPVAQVLGRLQIEPID